MWYKENWAFNELRFKELKEESDQNFKEFPWEWTCHVETLDYEVWKRNEELKKKES